MVTSEVEKAIEQLRTAYPDGVAVREDGEGGAYVIVDPIELGSDFLQTVTWIGFRITFQYPLSDVYPHFVRGDLLRADGTAVVAEGLQPNYNFEGRAALQISRRSNRLNPRTDTALIKLEKVVSWITEKGRP